MSIHVRFSIYANWMICVRSVFRGYWKLTRFALKRLASVLRRNRNLIKRYLKDYWGSASSREMDDAIDVILKVADRLDRFDKASSQYFVDVAASLGLSRGFGLAVYNAVMMLLWTPTWTHKKLQCICSYRPETDSKSGNFTSRSKCLFVK